MTTVEQVARKKTLSGLGRGSGQNLIKFVESIYNQDIMTRDRAETDCILCFLVPHDFFQAHVA
jgi:hypothetical protein